MPKIRYFAALMNSKEFFLFKKQLENERNKRRQKMKKFYKKNKEKILNFELKGLDFSDLKEAECTPKKPEKN
ncbi:MAG: hypothetical protein RBR08_06935 [Desulforegulaceae bacterium]|nr:hypothetical protein [Desulforegulaceae bacterium]